MTISWKGRIFEYMARPKKYATEEERKQSRRDYLLMYSRKRRNISDRDDLTNKHKKTKASRGDGYTEVYETLDRIRLNTIILTITVSFKYLKGIDWKSFEKRLHKVINDWLLTQENWDPKNKIIILDYPEDSDYFGVVRSFDLQIYLRRITEPKLHWKDTYPELVPLAELLETEIKNTCLETGIEITKRRSNNQKKLPDDAASETAEPDATVL